MKADRGDLKLLEFIVKFMKNLDSKLIYAIIITTIKLTLAWWQQCLEQKFLSRAKASSCWLLVIVILRVPQICALEKTTMTSTTYHQYASTMASTSALVNIVREQFATKSRRDNVVMGASRRNNNEEYDGDESEEVYDDTLQLNYSGESL
jgi:hypothetical protein